MRLACLAQLVNVIAPIMTEPGGPAWRQTIFYPIADVFQHGHGRVLRGLLEAPKAPGDDANARLLTAAAVLSLDGRELHVFAVNRDQHAPLPLRLDLRAFGTTPPRLTAWQMLTHSDLHATNSAEHPRRVCPLAQVSPSPLHLSLPAASWNHLRYSLA